MGQGLVETRLGETASSQASVNRLLPVWTLLPWAPSYWIWSPSDHQSMVWIRRLHSDVNVIVNYHYVIRRQFSKLPAGGKDCSNSSSAVSGGCDSCRLEASSASRTLTSSESPGLEPEGRKEVWMGKQEIRLAFLMMVVRGSNMSIHVFHLMIHCVFIPRQLLSV